MPPKVKERHLWFHLHDKSIFLSQGKFQLYGVPFE